MSEYPAHYAYPSAPPVLKKMPDPPRLHWGWVLLLSIITFGLFGAVWMLVQALWAKKVSGRNSAMIWQIIYLAYIPGMFFLSIVAGVIAVIVHTPVENLIVPLEVIARLGALVVALGAAFSLKGVLESSPINIPLSGVMTFFFGATYFQYHLQDFEWMPDGGVLVNSPLPENLQPAQIMGFHGPLPTAETPPSPPQAS